MKQTTQIVELRTLEPDKDYVLCNGNTYSDKVYLGVNDKVENWKEMTEEEAQELIQLNKEKDIADE